MTVWLVWCTSYLEIVSCPRSTKEGRDAGKRCQQKKADSITDQVAVVIPTIWLAEPRGERARVAGDGKQFSTKLTSVLVDGGEPLLHAFPVHQPHGARAQAGGDEGLGNGTSLVANSAEGSGGVL